MGQAYDEHGNVLGEATGETKAEVFEKLMRDHPGADSVEIHTMKPESQASDKSDLLGKVSRITTTACLLLSAHNNGQKRRLRGELHDLVDSL